MGDLEDFLAENFYVARRKFEKFHSLQREICRTSREENYVGKWMRMQMQFPRCTFSLSMSSERFH